MHTSDFKGSKRFTNKCVDHQIFLLLILQLSSGEEVEVEEFYVKFKGL